MEPLSPRDLLRWRTAGSLAFSPDGSKIAFVEAWSDAESNETRSAVFVVPSDGSSPARQLTFGPRSDSSPKWSPDGRLLAFLSTRETDWRADLYVLDMRGGDPRPVVTLPRGINEFAWSPDGSRLALTGRPAYPDDPYRPTDDEDERRERYQQRIVRVQRMHFRGDGARLVDDEQPALWVASVEDGEPRVVVAGDLPVAQPGWTPDGRVSFVSRREPDYEITWHDQVWAVGVDGGEPERFTDTDGAVLGYCFTDGGSLVCTAYPVGGLPIGCYEDRLVVDGKVVSADLGRNVGKHVLADTVDPIAGQTTPTCAGDDVYVQVSEAGKTHVYRYADGSWQPVITGDRVIGEFVVAADTIAFTSTSPTEPESIRVCRADGSDERVVHDPNPWMTERSVGTWRDLSVSLDGVQSQAWVMVPPGTHDRPPPGIVSIHGGPHGAYGLAFNLLLQMLSASGYAVILGNPPGSLTYGEEFAQLNHASWGEADFPHVMAYCDEAAAHGLVDPDRLGVTGGSYGGFLTHWAITHTDRFKAAVAARGVSNLTSIYGSSEFGWALMARCIPGEPWEEPELYRRLSPITYVADASTPTRFISCTEDFRVPTEQVEQMYIAMKRLGRDVDMVVFRDSHHLIYSGPPWNKVAHMEAILDWFTEKLPVRS
jgi:dipeptidyl aminopeptidase/acylaminoacyl peptidase